MAAAAAMQNAQDSGATWVAPFDNPSTIAGQGTVAREIVEQLADIGEQPSMVIVPVGVVVSFLALSPILPRRVPRQKSLEWSRRERHL